MGATEGDARDARLIARQREKARREKHKAARDELAEKRRLTGQMELIRLAQKARIKI